VRKRRQAGRTPNASRQIAAGQTIRASVWSASGLPALSHFHGDAVEVRSSSGSWGASRNCRLSCGLLSISFPERRSPERRPGDASVTVIASADNRSTYVGQRNPQERWIGFQFIRHSVGEKVGQYRLIPPLAGTCHLIMQRVRRRIHSIQRLPDLAGAIWHWLVGKIDFYRILLSVRKGLAQPFFDEVGRLLSTVFAD